MRIVSCSSCGETVEIVPGIATCSACGNSLNGVIPAEGTSQDYYARAESLAQQGDEEAAFHLVQDGLSKAMASDLLLLGAILGEKLGNYDLMRQYVSRIPVDDVLRSEGEWLLRAHQTRQRAQRQGADPSKAILEQMEAEFDPIPLSETHRDEALAGANRAEARESAGYIANPVQSSYSRRLVPAIAMLLLVGLVSLGWLYSDRLLSQSWVPTAFRTQPDAEVRVPGNAATDGSATTNTNSDDASSTASAGETGAGNAASDLPDGEPSIINEPQIQIDGQDNSNEAQPPQSDVDGNAASNAAGLVETPPTPTISAEQLLQIYQDSSSDGSSGTNSTDVSGADVSGADVSGANVSGTDMIDADTNNADVSGQSATEEGGSEQPVPVEPAPDNSVPDDVAEGPSEDATPEPIADANPLSIVEAVVQEPFDVLAYLRDYGRSDLAALPLDAQLVDNKLYISGVVKWYEERDAIISALSLAPNIDDVNPIGLKIRTPDTYTVQEGDTLWIIAFRIYGDGARWPQIYELNQDALVSPDALGLGQVLKVPNR